MDFKDLHKNLQQFPKTENNLSEAVDQTALGKRLGLEHLGKGIYVDAKGNKYTFNQQRQIFIGWSGTIKPSEEDLKSSEEKFSPRKNQMAPLVTMDDARKTIRYWINFDKKYSGPEAEYYPNPVQIDMAAKKLLDLAGDTDDEIDYVKLRKDFDLDAALGKTSKKVEEKPASNDPFEPKNIEKLDREMDVRVSFDGYTRLHKLPVKYRFEIAGIPMFIVDNGPDILLTAEDGTQLAKTRSENLGRSVSYFHKRIVELYTDPKKLKDAIDDIRKKSLEKMIGPEKKPVEKPTEKPIEKKKSNNAFLNSRSSGVPYGEGSNRTKANDSKDGVKVSYKTMSGVTKSGYVDYGGGYLVDPAKKRTEEEKHFADVKKKQIEMAKGIIQSEFDKLSDSEKVEIKKKFLETGTKGKVVTKLERAAYYMDANLSHDAFVEFVKTLGQDVKEIADSTMPPKLAKETFVMLSAKNVGMPGGLIEVPVKVEGSFKVGDHTFHIVKSTISDHETGGIKAVRGEYTAILDGVGISGGRINKKNFAREFKELKERLEDSHKRGRLKDVIANGVASIEKAKEEGVYSPEDIIKAKKNQTK